MEPFGAKITQKNEQNEQNDENNKTVNSDIFECDYGKEYKPKPKFTRSVKVKPYCFFFGIKCAILNLQGCKNEKLLPKYKELHPGCNYSYSKYSEQYSKLVIEAMGGDTYKEDKIISKIAKEVIIDKY